MKINLSLQQQTVDALNVSYLEGNTERMSELLENALGYRVVFGFEILTPTQKHEYALLLENLEFMAVVS